MFDYTNSDIKKYIDVDDGLRRIRGNKKLYKRMLDMLLTSEEFDKLKNELAAENYDEAEKAAHSIKGVTGNLSLPELFSVSVDLMQQLKNGAPDIDTIAYFWEVWDITKDYVVKVIEELN